MSKPIPTIDQLSKRIEDLERENAALRRDFSLLTGKHAVKVPEAFKPFFDAAQQTVRNYFSELKMDPSRGTIEINDQRYVLVRASAFSKGFLETILHLYADKGENEAFSIGHNFLFDYAHVIGMHDAKDFHQIMQLTDPLSKLSAGPVHFAYSGWAFVDIKPESNPTPDENFCLIYEHPYSFEADSWVRNGTVSKEPVCIMNAGYSSGWCEESFGIPLTAVEVSCVAKGDDCCRFIMSPPHKIQEHLERFSANSPGHHTEKQPYTIPTFFERKKVEEELERSRKLAEGSAKAKDDFIANMSHELRTPLGAILGFADLLQKTELDDIQGDYIEAINTSGKSLLSIINDILDLSKLDAGKFIIESVPFSVPELMHSVQVMFASKAAAKGLRLSCSVDMAINYQLMGDPMRLTQILVNLLGNAVKFTEAGGIYINCLVEKEEDNKVQLCFSVKDTGIGIDEDKLESVFERFSQADTDISRRYGGSGLGLAITRQLIELQGGQITFSSTKGNGAEFQFIIPYEKSAEQILVQQAAPAVKQRPYSFKKIMIVEDNLMNQKLASIILQNNGFDIIIATNGKKALEILKSQTVDLILMDIQMPVMDGYKTAKAIREELKITTPIIATTAHALSGEKEKCIQAGMDDYLSKPFKETDLLNKIASWAQRTQQVVAEADQENTSGVGIDLSFLLTQTRNNKSFVGEMIHIFKEQTPKDIAALKSAIDEADYKAIYRAAHSVRNGIIFFGLNRIIGDNLVQIEQMALAGKPTSDMAQHLEKVIEVCNAAILKLDSLSDDLN
jgi:CheY-like chemotaxis protein/predicted hydrocarbon binding protein/HPt (histidine-containing phosphotransfer) domain-containing protein